MSLPASKLDQLRSTAEKDRRRRRRERVGILLSALLVMGLLYLAIHLSRLSEQSILIQPVVMYFFNFAVWALVLVLVLVLVFLIVRNVVKFYFERRRGVLGAKLRMRLVVAFMALTLGPAAVLFLLSTFILNTSIERLYEPHVINVASTAKQVIEAASRFSTASRQVMQEKYEADGESALHQARELARAILEQGWINVLTGPESAPVELPEPGPESAIPTALEQLSHFLEYKRQEYDLDLVSVYDQHGRRIVRQAREGLDLPSIPAADIEKALLGEEGYIPPVSVGEGAVLYAFYPVPRRGGGESSQIAGAVVTGRYIAWIPDGKWLDPAETEEARAVIQDYETLHRLELPIKSSYFVLLVSVTLVVIFLAIWFGFYMAKGITEPIQLLAEGTQMVASGNLDYRIDLAADGDDEIATLVRSFNQMTADLARNRTDLDYAYQNVRETNLELDQRRRYMETVLANVAAGVISLDGAGNVLTVNPAALAMLGKPAGEVLGRALATVFRPEEMSLFHALVDELERTGKEMVQRQVVVARDRKSVVLLLTVSRLSDDQGQIQGMVVVIDDMTELVRAHRAMAWREVARRIAHEIKNPLTPIQLAAQRLERRYAERLGGEDAEVFTESIHTTLPQVEDLHHLVNEFSLFARLPSIQPEPSDLARIIREALALYRDAHPAVTFTFQEGPGLPSLELDREQIKRVFLNLLDNAVASLDGQGEVTIETMYNEQLQVVRVEVADTGKGMPSWVRDRIFEPYYSTKPEGTGLGLTIVQRIISDHYGYIRVVDNQPRGTRVVIELPVVLAERKIEPGDQARTM